jgi:N-acetylglucosaminyl-diphospho-decaprenol L-rhamnosyltransferase
MSNLLSVIIVTFNPDYDILNRCLNTIPKEIKIYLIDNSKNINKEKILDFQLRNLIISRNDNLGNGHGINKGIDLANTKYVLYLDVDTMLEKNFIPRILTFAEKIKDFAVIAPSLRGYKYKKNNYIKNHNFINKDYSLMNFVEGAVMLLNRDIIKLHNIKFDTKIFLYWEEVDFFFQSIKKKQKIYLLNNVFAYHEGGKSINKNINSDIELNRNWHIMWSKFYYFKKNFGYLVAYKKTIKQFISANIRFAFYFILKNKKKNIYLERVKGLFASYTGKPSFRRPIINARNNK